MTPMIDVVFQLMIFFLLVAQFSRQQTIELELARAPGTEVGAEAAGGESRVVVNVVPEDREEAMGGAYRIGSRAFEGSPDGIEAMAEALREIAGRRAGIRVLIRADRSESYERAQAAMRAVALAGIGAMELVTIAPEEPR